MLVLKTALWNIVFNYIVHTTDAFRLRYKINTYSQIMLFWLMVNKHLIHNSFRFKSGENLNNIGGIKEWKIPNKSKMF